MNSAFFRAGTSPGSGQPGGIWGPCAAGGDTGTGRGEGEGSGEGRGERM